MEKLIPFRIIPEKIRTGNELQVALLSTNVEIFKLKYPIARVLKSVKRLPQIFISHLNVLQPTTLRIHICHQNSTFFVHAKFQDV